MYNLLAATVIMDVDEEAYTCCALLLGCWLLQEEEPRKMRKREVRSHDWLLARETKGSYASLHRELRSTHWLRGGYTV